MKHTVRKKVAARHEKQGVPIVLATLIILLFLFIIFYVVLRNPVL